MPPTLSIAQVKQLTDWVATYIADQRAYFYVKAKPIGSDQLNLLRPFFPEDILRQARVARGREQTGVLLATTISRNHQRSAIF